MAYENSQLRGGPVHGVDQSKFGMVDSSQQYYQVTDQVFIAICFSLITAAVLFSAALL